MKASARGQFSWTDKARHEPACSPESRHPCCVLNGQMLPEWVRALLVQSLRQPVEGIHVKVGLQHRVDATKGFAGMGGEAANVQPQSPRAAGGGAGKQLSRLADHGTVGFQTSADRRQGPPSSLLLVDHAEERDAATERDPQLLGGDQRRGHRAERTLGVAGAAPVDPPVAEHTLEGIARPGFGSGHADGVHVAVEEQAAAARARAQRGREVGAAGPLGFPRRRLLRGEWERRSRFPELGVEPTAGKVSGQPRLGGLLAAGGVIARVDARGRDQLPEQVDEGVPARLHVSRERFSQTPAPISPGARRRRRRPSAASNSRHCVTSQLPSSWRGKSRR